MSDEQCESVKIHDTFVNSLNFIRICNVGQYNNVRYNNLEADNWATVNVLSLSNKFIWPHSRSGKKISIKQRSTTNLNRRRLKFCNDVDTMFIDLILHLIGIVNSSQGHRQYKRFVKLRLTLLVDLITSSDEAISENCQVSLCAHILTFISHNHCTWYKS